MSSPYRLKWNPESNMARDTRISGAISVAAGGAIVQVRPSASVNNQPNAGAGYMFNVTATGTTQATYNVAYVEQYLKPVGAFANFQVAFTAGNGQAVHKVTCECSTYDAASNSFNITLVDSTTGTAIAPASVAAGLISFEARFINTVSPSTL